MKSGDSSTRFALLGFLSLGPMSGYDIRKLVRNSIAHFWNESYGQIYPLLRKLTDEGLVRRERHTQRGKPDRLVYSITAAGRRELASWLERPPQAPPPRNELLLKMFFSAGVDVPLIAWHVARMQEEAKAEMLGFDALGEEIGSRLEGNVRLPFWQMTLDFRRRQCQMTIEWCDATLARLEEMAATPK